MTKTIYKKDLDNKKIFVTREFAGSIEQVWAAWTQSDFLDQWWAPKPWKAITVKLEFKEGGRWLYYMQGPDGGGKHFSALDYKKIIPLKSYEGDNAFTDEKGNPTTDFTNWKVAFSAVPSGTKVEVEMTFASLESLEMLVKMGFEGGFAMAHNNLDEVLAEK
jgi:uncharacterized protein YndB with AHSA1/START domain